MFCNIWNVAGIKGIWNLQKSSSDSFDTYLVLAFVGETRILEINAEDELGEAEIEGFDAEQQVHTTWHTTLHTTLHTTWRLYANMLGGTILLPVQHLAAWPKRSCRHAMMHHVISVVEQQSLTVRYLIVTSLSAHMVCKAVKVVAGSTQLGEQCA